VGAGWIGSEVAAFDADLAKVTNTIESKLA
jgi:hypothetical protein